MPAKPMKDTDTMAAEIRVMGIPLKHSGHLHLSTRLRTPENSTMASRKPRPEPRELNMAWTKPPPKPPVAVR